MTAPSRRPLADRPFAGAPLLFAAVRSAAAVLAVAFAVAAADGWARPRRAAAAAPGPDAARGVTVPDASVAEGADARVMAVNPAGLLRLSGRNLVYQAAIGEEGDVPGVRPGHGVWAALPLGGQIALGLGHERRPDAEDGAGVHRTTLAFAGGGAKLAYGSNLHVVASGEDAFATFTSWEAGVVAAPFRHLSAGAVVRDADRTRFAAGRTLDRVWEVGLALRPYTERVTLGGGVVLVEDAGAPLSSAGGFLELVPIEGLTLRGGADVRGGAKGAGAPWDGPEIALRATLGVDLSAFGVRSSVLTGRGDAFDAPTGAAIAVRVASDRYAALVDKRPALVEMRLSGAIGETASRPLPFLPPSGRTIAGVVESLRRLEDHPEVAGVLLTIEDLDVAYARAEELRGALEALRAAGKKVYAYLTYADHRDYLVAAAADEVRIHPAGAVLLTGVQATFSYYRQAMSRVGVAGDFVAIGKFKNAPDAFTRDAMGDPQREAESALLDSVYGDLVSALAGGRRLTEEQVRAFIAEGPYDAESAKAAGLVDGISHYDEWKEALAEDHAVREAPPPNDRRVRWGADPILAVVTIDGVITSGESREAPLFGGRTAGARTLVKALDAARKSAAVKGILLRISSPGGSATASESIHRAVLRAKEKKPVVVSMGSVAASGGYYAAAPATRIFADPSTVTGSIGIYAGKVSLAGLWDLLTIHKETLRRGERADMFSIDRPFTDAERDTLRARLGAGYDLFVKRVGEGRGKTREQVEAVAQGRIWSGRDALAQGLVDELGGWRAALAKCKELAGLSEDADVAVVPFGAAAGLGAVGDLVAAVAGEAPNPAASALGPLPGDLAVLAALLTGGFASGEPLYLMDPIANLE